MPAKKKSAAQRIQQLRELRAKKAHNANQPPDPSTAFFGGAPGPDGPDHTSEQSPQRHHMSAQTTRRALAAVAVGAIAAAFITIYFSGGFKADSELSTHSPGDDAAATGAVAGKAFGTATQGDCLTWTKADASDLSQTDCNDEHLFEVAAEVDLSKYPGAEFGPGSRFPGVLRFTELRDEHCIPAVNDYLGSRFDPHGRFEVGMINPGEAGWSAGERTLRCGLQVTGSTGAQRPVKGTVASQDQSKVTDPGVCVGINGNVPTDPVDCARPHAFESAGIIDLSTHFQGPAPTPADQDKFLDGACTQTVNQYLGSPDTLRNKTLTIFWDNPDAVSWLAGSRKVSCLIGKGGDAEGFAPIVNSAKGDILINGQPPVPPPAIPEGRALPTPLPGAAPAPIPPR